MSDTSSTSRELLAALAAEFPKSEVRQRQGRGGLKLDYIGIDTTINRLNEVLGMGWSAWIQNYEVTESLKGGEYLAVVTLQLSVHDGGTSRCGTGAATASDPDDAIKTAQAEALKKAANLYGVALYLWDEGKRDEIAEYRSVADGSLKSIKAAVVAKAGTTDRKALAAALGVSEADLDNKDALLQYLAA